MYTLTDTFNKRKISSHRTVEAAVKAERKHLRAVKRANGRDSYLTYSITQDGKPVDRYEIEQAEYAIESGR